MTRSTSGATSRWPRASRSTARPSRLTFALVIGSALLASSCTGGSDDQAVAPPRSAASPLATAPDPAGPMTTAGTTPATKRSPGCGVDAKTDVPRATHERIDMDSGGTSRWYAQFVPTAYDGEPTPLVIDLHGYLSGSAGQVTMSDFGSVAEDAGIVLATPQGNSDMPYWNAVPRAELPDDVGFIEDIIDDVGERLCIDLDRVYVDGLSNGAFLTSLIACRLSDRVAAVAAVAGLLLPAGCAPSRAVPVLAVHGTEDRYVSFTGGPGPALAGLPWNEQSTAAFDGLPWADVTTTAARWAELQQCKTEPTRTKVGDAVTRVEYLGCATESTVQLYVVEGGGHTWPSSEFSIASEPILGPTTKEIDATELIWSFFRDHPMR